MNGSIKVKGGRRLVETVTPIPNKNSLMAVLSAAVLAHGGVLYRSVPKTSDVEKLLAIYKSIGAIKPS